MVENGFLKISFQKYRMLDLLAFTLFIFISEMASTFVENSEINDIYFTFSIFVYALVIFRWNWYGLISGVIGFLSSSIISLFIYKLDIVNFLLSNVFANLFGIFTVLVFYLGKDKISVKKKIRSNFVFIGLYYVIPFIFIGIGKGIVGVIISQGTFISNVIHYIFNYQILSIFASILIGILLSKHQSLMVDQIMYLKDIEEERKESSI